MIRAYGADAVRAAERPLLEAGSPLMLRAAHGLASHTLTWLDDRRGRRPRRADDLATARVLVLAGSGNNGGDGLYAAALLRRIGVGADAIATGSRVDTDAASALREAGGTITELEEIEHLPTLLDGTDVVLDAILGIGGRPEVPQRLRPLLEAVRAAGIPVMAVDVPSFIDATTGAAADAALPAISTVTFGALKAGLLLPPAADLAGRIHHLDLGLGPHLPRTAAVERLQDQDVTQLWPIPEREASKYTRGVVAIAAGSSDFPGAAVMAGAGAARAGAGMVRCLAPQPVVDLVLGARPEIVGHRTDEDGPTHPQPAIDLEQIGRTHALVLGPGLPVADPRCRAGLELLSVTGRLRRGVVDAGGLDAITAEDRFGPDVVLTPHRGEAERLARRLGADPAAPGADLARALASATGATVLLKGAITLIAPGDGAPVLSQDDATAQLASAGTGDVLAGVAGSLLAAGLPGPTAAALAALIHGRAGRAASRDGRLPLVALDVADHLPAALAAILTDAPS